VADTNLFPDEASFTPRPAWQVIEAARRRYLTGELALPTNPATRIFLRDGMVYFAERSSDGTLPVRLMMEGVITREQMQRGTVIVNGIEHVGRMFDADPTIDRSSVELCAELFTEDVMVSVANTTISSYELHLYRRHSSGIDRWYPHSVPAATKSSESQAAEQGPAPGPKARAAETSPVAKAPAKPKPQPDTQTASSTGPRNSLTGPPITQAVPVTRPVTTTATTSATTTPPPPPITQAVPVTHSAPVTTQVPVTMPAPTAQIPVTESTLTSTSTSTSTAASDEVDTNAIADEVAEAIRRAFAGMGAGF
jgi:hypothetical protein